MYLLDGSDPSFLQALFAQRMLRSIAVTDSLPCSAVGLMDIGRTAVFVVLAVHQFSVFLTILAVRQLWTSGISTAALWFSWHFSTSRIVVFIVFMVYNITILHTIRRFRQGSCIHGPDCVPPTHLHNYFQT